jgi:hypothetical protein
MTYRDVSECLRQYRERLATDLDEARRDARDAQTRADRLRALTKELAETDALLAQSRGVRRRWAPVATVCVIGCTIAGTATALATQCKSSRSPVPAQPAPVVAGARHYLEGVVYDSARR